MRVEAGRLGAEGDNHCCAVDGRIVGGVAGARATVVRLCGVVSGTGLRVGRRVVGTVIVVASAARYCDERERQCQGNCPSSLLHFIPLLDARSARIAFRLHDVYNEHDCSVKLRLENGLLTGSSFGLGLASTGESRKVELMSEANPPSIGASHTPLRQAVTDAIRDRIIEGTYPQASRLYEETIAAELGVSRNPIREAFQTLSAEGFVHIEPRRGARVAVIDTKRAAEIFAVRCALEGLVAELAAANATPTTSGQLGQIVADGTAAIVDGDLSDLPKLNTQFHEHLAAMADNALLTSMIRQLSDIVRWIYAERLESRVRQSWSEHADLASAIEAGDRARAHDIAVRHIEAARVAFLGPDAG
ncbi:GntR family transcriptional regulator [Ilumatobacter fluminis]|nr:GntR family transcriptional regulator [Ilumatobacter fluminis]